MTGQRPGPLDPELPTVQLGSGDPHRRVSAARHETQRGDRQDSDGKQSQIPHIATFRRTRETTERVLGLIHGADQVPVQPAGVKFSLLDLSFGAGGGSPAGAWRRRGGGVRARLSAGVVRPRDVRMPAPVDGDGLEVA